MSNNQSHRPVQPLAANEAALVARLTADAEQVWGAARARDLAEAIQSTARTLALVASLDLGPEDAEPDFIDEES